MARKTALVSVQQISEINLTPLMDLTFILLITFIITFPLIEQGIPINLPTGEASDMEPKESLSLSLNEKGELFLDERAMDIATLEAELMSIRRVDPDVTVLVRADESIRYGKLVDVMSVLHKAKISKMALVTKTGEEVGGGG